MKAGTSSFGLAEYRPQHLVQAAWLLALFATAGASATSPRVPDRKITQVASVHIKELTTVEAARPVNRPDDAEEVTVPSPTREWTARLRAEEANTTRLDVISTKSSKEPTHKLTDEDLQSIENVLWVGDDLLCFAVSEAYSDKPGIFLWNIPANTVTEIVKGVSPLEGNGEFFDLVGFWADTRELAFYRGMQVAQQEWEVRPWATYPWPPGHKLCRVRIPGGSSK